MTIFQEGVQDIDSAAIMDVILLTQYFDTISEIGTSKNRGTNVIFYTLLVFFVQLKKKRSKPWTLIFFILLMGP